MEELSHAIYRSFEKKDIQYCLLRDSNQIDPATHLMELDILVNPNHLRRLEEVLLNSGFVHLPDWGFSPHHFYLIYDKPSDRWIKFDVVTRVAFGRPYGIYRTTLGEACLGHRKQEGNTYLPATEDEFITLLLHSVLDKGFFSPARLQRLQLLRKTVKNEEYLTRLLASYWLPEMTWSRFTEMIDGEGWEALLTDRLDIEYQLARRDFLGTFVRRFGYRILRKLNRWVNPERLPALTIALMAPDGAGKSTLVEKIRQSFYFPVSSVYMGLYQKPTRKASNPLKEFLTPVRRLFKLWTQALVLRYYQLRQRITVCDRYPYEALLSAHKQLNFFKKGYRWLLAHACPAPDLVLFLDAPGEVLYARKGEHSPAFLEEQRRSYLELLSSVPQTVVVDATQEAEAVRIKATQLIWEKYIDHLRMRKLNKAQEQLPSRAR